MIYLDGQPCYNKNCYSHVITPCEICGRVKCIGSVTLLRNENIVNLNRIRWEDDKKSNNDNSRSIGDKGISI